MEERRESRKQKKGRKDEKKRLEISTPQETGVKRLGEKTHMSGIDIHLDTRLY